jgi:hypothetical protein
VEGVDQHHADIDELLRKVGLYRLLQSACGDPYD